MNSNDKNCKCTQAIYDIIRIPSKDFVYNTASYVKSVTLIIDSITSSILFYPIHFYNRPAFTFM